MVKQELAQQEGGVSTQRQGCQGTSSTLGHLTRETLQLVIQSFYQLPYLEMSRIESQKTYFLSDSWSWHSSSRRSDRRVKV